MKKAGAAVANLSTSDYFAVLGLERQFAIDPEILEKRYFEMQRQYHPDKFAHKPVEERIKALHQSTLLNSAYQSLKNPVSRAGYLMQGKPEFPPSQALLIESLEARERLQEADSKELQVIQDETVANLKEAFAMFDQAFSLQQWSQAAEAVHRLTYLDKLAQEIRQKKQGQGKGLTHVA